MIRTYVTGLAAVLVAAATLAVPHAAPAPAKPAADSSPLAFPGAMGWAAHTPGGRGGQIIKVTNLNGDGPPPP